MLDIVLDGFEAAAVKHTLSVSHAASVLLELCNEHPTEPLHEDRELILRTISLANVSPPPTVPQRTARGLRLLAWVAHDIALYAPMLPPELGRQLRRYQLVVACEAVALDPEGRAKELLHTEEEVARG